MSLSDFVILQKLGSGSFASVFKVRRLIDQQIYALKKIDLKALGTRQKNNSLNQIRLLACLSSQYIIGYCESFFDQKLDILCIAMEYANQGDLFKKIQIQKKLRCLIPQVEVWKIFIHLLYGLNELHSKNILHRDLKSENVFITNGIYKIGDMNVSKIIKNGLACTQTGTPYYASPEVWNDQPYNQKSDIYSLGCILYEVAALRPPYEASSMQKLFDMVTKSSTPKIPSTYSRELQCIIDQCLQKNPHNRPSTKTLLQNNTVKIYENLLIQFKPQVEFNSKQPFLKTIYMPSSKKELKHQLPQSNYKSQQKDMKQNQNYKSQKNQNEKSETKQEPLISQKTQIKTEKKQKNFQIKEALMNIDNFINKNELSKKKEQSQLKPRNRIQSCQIFKDSSKSMKKVGSKQNLIARADFIIQSQRKVNKSRQIKITNNSVILCKNKQIKKSAEKNTNDKIQKQKLSKQVQMEQLKPKKLIFDDASIKIKQQQVVKQIQKWNLPQKTNIKIQQIKQRKQQRKLNCQQSQDKNSIDKYQKIKDEYILYQLSLKNAKNDICKGVYLLDTIKNCSIISNKDHSHYKFQEQIQKSQYKQVKTQQTDKSLQNKQTNQNQTISSKVKIQSQRQCLQEDVNIIINVNENKQIIKSTKSITSQSKLNLLIAVEKIKNITQKISFKFKLSVMSCLRNQFHRQKLLAKEQQYQLKLYQQSHKNIIETLATQAKISHQKTPTKTYQQRNRSKSIRKTQKYNPTPTQNNKQSKTVLVDKLNQKMGLSSNVKQNKSTQILQKSMKKQSNNKLIDNKQNLVSEQYYKNLHQKVKQMALIPKGIEEINNKVLSKQKKKYYQHQTSQKPKCSVALKVIEQNNIISSNKSEKKIAKNSIFSQGANCFEQKKKKIFQNNPNPVYQVSERLDRINLQKKLKKYINV